MTPNRGVDADFLALPCHELADAALSAARAAGADYADLRIQRLTSEVIRLRDAALETSVVGRELAPGVAAETARRAVGVARTLCSLNAERIELADEPVYSDAQLVSFYEIDPFDVAAADKIGVLEDYSRRLLAADGVDHVSAAYTGVKEQSFYANTFGSSITQQRVRVQPTLEAVTVDAAAGNFESMRTLAPPTARGWEAAVGDGVWNWS